MNRLTLYFLPLGLLLVACSQPVETPEAVNISTSPTPASTETAIPSTIFEESPPTEMAPEPTSSPTVTPSATPVEVADHCLDCHTDKEQLIATARQEEDVPDESSGPG